VRYPAGCQRRQTGHRATLCARRGREHLGLAPRPCPIDRTAILLIVAAMLAACSGTGGVSSAFSLPTPSPTTSATQPANPPITVGSVTASPRSTATPTATSAPERAPTPSPTPIATSSATPTATQEPVLSVFVQPALPGPFARSVQRLATRWPEQVTLVESEDGADVLLALNRNGEGDPAGFAVYAVAAPFPTVDDEVSWTDVVSTWNGAPQGALSGGPLLLTADTAEALATRLGPPGPGGVEIVSDEDMISRAWDSRPSWAIVPFDRLEPRWKVLRVDGVSVLDREFDPADYPLALGVSLRGDPEKMATVRQLLGSHITNREPEKISIVVMTGVTALTRGTAMSMDRHGTSFPAQDIRSWLVEPDITHISNEVSFAEDCPPPASYVTTVFCANPLHIELFDSLGIDIVELTGNHLLDWGREAMELSLRMYEERDLPYFGGGWNLAQAQSAVTLTAGMHTFAFLGCNPVGPRADWATDTSPGSAACDYQAMLDDIRQLRADGVIPIVTLQYLESYQYEPLAQQRTDFVALAEAGAAIVSGSQAHQPQGFAFEHGAFIHYGLGNLFFDQMWSLETRQEFVDRHVFYDGRHISTEVLTAMLEDWARPRPMTASERESLLHAAFSASDW